MKDRKTIIMFLINKCLSVTFEIEKILSDFWKILYEMIFWEFLKHNELTYFHIGLSIKLIKLQNLDLKFENLFSIKSSLRVFYGRKDNKKQVRKFLGN